MRWLGAAFMASSVVTALSLAMLWTGDALSRSPFFDASDPDHAMIARQLRDARDRVIDGKSDAVLDLASLNGGEWQEACLFGGYTHPAETLERLGARLDLKDRVELDDMDEQFGRLSEVEEFDAMVAYVTSDNQARLIYFEDAFGSRGQHFEECIRRPQTSIRM